jgi:hypothetical protein
MYRVITQIQQSCHHIYCIKCTLSYPKKWYDMKLNRCFFCTFHSPTYRYLLKELEWQFIKSGEVDRNEYYQEYLMLMKEWCSHYHIEPNEEDRKIEKDIQYEMDTNR